MAVLDGKVISGRGFSNEIKLARVMYDFSKDGGGIGTYEALEADSDCLVVFKCAYVHAAGASGGSMTMRLGKGLAGVEFLSAKPVAELGLGKGFSGLGGAVKLVAGEKIEMGISAAALTAGKIELFFEVMSI